MSNVSNVTMHRGLRSNGQTTTRPIMLAIAGDSAAGKTTITKGLVEALGPDRITSICVDDYHRFDRAQRKELNLPFTPLHPECNYMEIMEQHLQLLAMGNPILKPVYNHEDGTLDRPVLVEPREFVIIEGLLPLHTKLSRACFDATVYLDPPEPVRFQWKVNRDTAKRGYQPEEVKKDLAKREVESAAFIRPQRANADIVVRFGPIEGRDELPEGLGHTFQASPPKAEAANHLDDYRDECAKVFEENWAAMEKWTAANQTPLSATLLLRPTIAHPSLSRILTDDHREAMHLKLARDEFDKPVDALHIHSYAEREVTREVEEEIWKELEVDESVPESLGTIDQGNRSEPLAITQLILLYHMFLALKDR
ncbi:MAG TPA: phosphoribulokinase [Egibacteraceae bacterium]|nr:phosphoribulokinase [Acidimicrobiales bacterium]HVM13886.1 phosphoribulokinase [Egibacteraceae bacterium]